MICKELQNILKENSGKTDSIYEEISYKLLYHTSYYILYIIDKEIRR